MRNLSAIEDLLPPDESVVLDADYDDPPLVDAVHAAWGGDWSGAGRLLEFTRTGPDWELRAHHVQELAEAALDEDRWLHHWHAQAPNDPNVLVVLAEHLIDRAWEARGAKLAAHTSDEQFVGFLHYLEQVEPVLRRAIAANPADPTPWASMITLAMGSPGGRRDLYEEAWHHLGALDPLNRGAHFRALQFCCAKWHGSDEEMFRLAYRASDSAPPGSPLHTLPLWAWMEYDLFSDEKVLDSSQAREAVNRALTVCPPNAPATYRRDRVDRNLLVRTLYAQHRSTEALGQFQALGVHATSSPWNIYGAKDPRQKFLDFRDAVKLTVAEEMV
ncbi:hypothetical protein EFW17_04565 [Halostreptopolyspora alba]|uniref:DUF4034 domain-containing protein n=2 Tax=Halostreptopolyspora alba TaxID=2487137 RepID=A0A3N0EFM0_9ACTN|nr:hypothetical protein EFW17_04565 [Nocardiopsaceae bacterium YIM 96095]